VVNTTTTVMADVIALLCRHLDADGKRRAAAQLRERAVAEVSPSSMDFLDSIADALDHYAEGVELEGERVS
jgi:SAM-dependent MidA family methyltransferase